VVHNGELRGRSKKFRNTRVCHYSCSWPWALQSTWLAFWWVLKLKIVMGSLLCWSYQTYLCTTQPCQTDPSGSLIEAVFTVNHRIPSQAKEDGLSFKTVPLYGDTITTPDGKTIIVMEYAQHTCCLSLPSNKHFSEPKWPSRVTPEILLTCALPAAHLSIPAIHYIC